MNALIDEFARGRVVREYKSRRSPEASLVATRKEIQRAWLAVGDILIRKRQPELAD